MESIMEKIVFKLAEEENCLTGRDSAKERRLMKATN
jgi:hypothetical protein